MSPDGKIETNPEWNSAGYWFNGEWHVAPSAWGIEACPDGKIFVVESYNGWTHWMRNTDVPSREAAVRFIERWFDGQVREAEAS